MTLPATSNPGTGANCKEVDSSKENLVADACRHTEGATDGFNIALQSMAVSTTGEEKRTHRTCASIFLLPSRWGSCVCASGCSKSTMARQIALRENIFTL